VLRVASGMKQMSGRSLTAPPERGLSQSAVARDIHMLRVDNSRSAPIGAFPVAGRNTQSTTRFNS